MKKGEKWKTKKSSYLKAALCVLYQKATLKSLLLLKKIMKNTPKTKTHFEI